MKTPELGFYYHYKHNPAGEFNNYAYEVLNIGHHTEIDGLDESAMVVYRPLYESAGVYKIGKHWDVRPLEMFMEKVEKDGVTKERFTKITDPEIISKLNEVIKKLYWSRSDLLQIIEMIEVEKKFNLTDEEIERLTDGATFQKEIIIHDVYLDTDDYRLTLQDMWLRNRDGKFEMKVPTHKRQDFLFADFRELTTDDEIKKAIGFTEDGSLQDLLTRHGFKPFAEFVSTRRKYKKDDFTFDIDSIDYGYNVAEIELMVETDEEAAEAKERIMALATSLNLEVKIVRGKLTEYMFRFRPKHHKALLDAGILKL